MWINLAVVTGVVLGLGACALEPDDEAAVDTAESPMLSGEQVYELANVYNTGVANGFVLSFASAQRFTEMDTSYDYQRQFWPGGPVAGGALGAAITMNGLALPTFDALGVSRPPWSGDAFARAQANSNRFAATLIDRTWTAAYFSLGSLIASAEYQASAGTNPKAWSLALSLLRSATDLANALCRPSPNVWRTAFDVGEMRWLLQTAPLGPNNLNWPAWNTTDVVKYLYTHIVAIRYHLGSVIADPSTIESGVHGIGCL